jgi:hypothetical protein
MNMVRAVSLSAIILLAATVGPALAGSVMVGSDTISLPTPNGFCELSATSDPSEKRMLTTVGEIVKRGGNALLNMSADCQQLAAWDAHQRQFIDDLAQYLSPLADAVPQSIKESCAELRSQGDQFTKDAHQQINENLEQMASKMTFQSSKFAGVLDEDANTCYAAILQKLQTEAGTDKVQLGVLAMTIVKGHSINLYRFGPYSGVDTPNDLLAKLKETVAAFYAANPG